MNNKIVISCHADTGFKNHRLKIDENGDYYGHLDNFAGVYAVMNAYFSGFINNPFARIELTYGEETDMEGAYEVLETLNSNDVVIVIDVTGTPTESDIVIEKCSDTDLKQFVTDALIGISFDIYSGCPDPIANEDECDVYKEKLEKVCFLGIPCTGGDYNAGLVTVKRKSIEAATNAIIKLVNFFTEKFE
jgi:hypothetical protein